MLFLPWYSRYCYRSDCGGGGYSSCGDGSSGCWSCEKVGWFSIRWLTLIWHYIRSRRSGSWRLKKQTRDIFSPVEVVVNSHHENQIEVTEVGEVFEVEVMNQTGKVETNMDEVDGATEREYVNCPSDG